MQTHFTSAQLQNADIRAADGILRNCVHCGFCLATCPTYALLGDELDSPRGRIYLIKDMLEGDKPANDKVTRHIDRCLSCLACMTTCPSGVNYMHLVDMARERIEETYRRPLFDRVIRWWLARIIPYPGRFRAALRLAAVGKALKSILPQRVRAMLDLAPASLPPQDGLAGGMVVPAEGERKTRVALLAGCAQRALDPAINAATIRLLTRLGCEVVVAQGAGCCGSLVHHMGKTSASHAQAKANIDAWLAEAEGEGLDAVVVNASGCGTTVKDYGYMLREDAEYADKASRVSDMAMDVSEFLEGLDLSRARAPEPLRVAYHSACSLQHGQGVHALPKALLSDAGYEVVEVPEAHLCCGSAGTYNLLQPDLAGRLKERKLANLDRTGADVVAAGNIGCIMQLADGGRPIVHTVELLDWATGGPKPARMSAD